jgi:hypothetical protein
MGDEGRRNMFSNYVPRAMRGNAGQQSKAVSTAAGLELPVQAVTRSVCLVAV